MKKLPFRDLKYPVFFEHTRDTSHKNEFKAFQTVGTTRGFQTDDRYICFEIPTFYFIYLN